MTEHKTPPVDDPKIINRLHSLTEIYNFLPPVYKTPTYLNGPILRHCVESYFLDLGRTKDFHRINLGDQFKKTAFTLKWIVKTKPIQVHPGSPVTKQVLLVNEVYAIVAALGFLKYKTGGISPEFMNNLIYTLHYRPIDEGVLTSMMYLLAKAIHGEGP